MRNADTLQENRDVLGYTLKKRIGSGGFGEVWSAIAPGGLPKALKIVYGYHDEKRAQTELKALDRVKELRHPFLLSLERIEIYEGQLIVVSELADKSLADLFNEYQAKGEPGIPRDLLLKFIRSSADALDYLSEEHGLQHLDIKPENLLVVGGHVKVADFGLIKELNNVSQSLVSGMTPNYAAPEVFDGRPGKFSDQYSLAVLYQEMLTGQRPFPGTTPAQLAAQHIHGKPNLRALPTADQPIVAKALAKDPNLRFHSCRDFAEELSNVKRATRTVVRRMNPTERDQQDTRHKTVQFNNPDITSVVSSDALPFQAREIKLLDPPDLNPENATLRPVYILGVGATANRIVSLIKRQIIARHGSMENVPAVRLLCIDTDRNEVTRLCMSDDDTAMGTHETLAIPLMKPEQYREKMGSRLSWLSRRWIFNIPRSLQTEGLRPLGRLAFAEHFESICNKLEETLKQLPQPEAIAKTAETLAIDPGKPQPRVYVISSISGGVGSGMVLDLAYTIRLILAEQGHDADSSELIGLLLHSAYQRTRDPGLAAANSFACLTEMRHYIESGYPGDKSIGMPEFGKIAPFEYTYYCELGNDLSQTDFEQQLVNVAEYVYLATMSKCSEFFSHCRAIEQQQSHFSLRTFGMSAAGPESFASRTETVYKIGTTMLQRWLKGRPGDELNPNQLVDSQILHLNLSTVSVKDWITQQTNQTFNHSLDQVFAGAIQSGMNLLSKGENSVGSYLDGALGKPERKHDLKCNENDPEICHELAERIIQHAGLLAEQILRQITDQLNQQAVNLAAAKTIEGAWQNRLELMSSEINRLRDQVNDQLSLGHSYLERFTQDKLLQNKVELAKYQEALQQYCNLRMEEFVLRFAGRFYRRLISSVVAVRDTLIHFERSLNELLRFFASKSDALMADTSANRPKMENLLIQCVEKNLSTMVVRSELQVYQSLAASMGGYLEFFNHSSLVKQLPQNIIKIAQAVLADAHQKISLEETLAENNIGIEQVVKWISEQVKLAQPIVKDCGGGLRSLLGLPALTQTSILPELIRRHLDFNVAPIKGTRGSFVFCFEGEDVSLANIAFRLLQLRPDAIELVKRLHTRSDIEWSTLNDLF
jgi:serine/threonine protein kinase